MSGGADRAAGGLVIRERADADLEGCAQALAAAHRDGGYPSNWPADPVRWLTPARLIRAWVAVAPSGPVAGHVALRRAPAGLRGRPAAEVCRLFVIPAARQQGIAAALLGQVMAAAAAAGLGLVLEVAGHLHAARRLYERSGFALTGSGPAAWARPGGAPVTLYRYAWRPGRPGGQGETSALR